MGLVRLNLIAPELTDRCRQASEMARRMAAVEVCAYAVASTGITEPIIENAIAKVRQEPLVAQSLTLRAELTKLTDQLDERYFDLKEAWERGEASEFEFNHAFQQARAANAVAACLKADS